MGRLILFDFDGVLVRSNHCHLKNMKDTFLESGIPLDADDDEILSHFGKHYKVVIHELLDEMNRTPEVKKRLEDKLREKFENDDFSKLFEKIEGLDEYLNKLRKKGHVLAIASGNSHYVLEKWVESIGIGRFFGLLIGADDVKCGKPDPEMILKATEYFGIPVTRTVYVGDTENDVLMAKNAGCVSAVVLSGVLRREDAEMLGADMIAEDVTKLGL